MNERRSATVESAKEAAEMRRPYGLPLSCVCALLVCMSLSARGAHAQADTSAAETDVSRIQRMVDGYLDRLDVPERVLVSVVPSNALMVSVESIDEGQSGFLLSVEKDFVGQLSEEELGAALAHELGHVWIFTHHPFLQTEALANQIAMRLVPRDNLVRVYEKVWSRLGTKGELARFVGD